MIFKQIFKKFFKKEKKTTIKSKDNYLEGLIRFLATGKSDLVNKTKEDLKSMYNNLKNKQNVLLENSNVNLFNPQMQLLHRDIYGISNDISIRSIMQILSRESIVNLGSLEFFLEMLTKNEELARLVLNKPIINAFANMNISFSLSDNDVNYSDIINDFEKQKKAIITACIYAELYGGSYICINGDNLKVYSPSQICIDDNKDKNINHIDNIYDMFSSRKKLILNEALLTRTFDSREFKQMGFRYIDFDDGARYSYENVFAFNGSKSNFGKFNKQMTNGFNISRFDGNLHYLLWITDLYETLYQNAMTGNRYIIGIKDYTDIINSISGQGYQKYQEILEKTVLTKTGGGILTDAENNISTLTNQVPYNVILENLIIKTISIIWSLPVNEVVIENKSNAYKSDESIKAENEGKDNLKKMIILNYKSFIYNLLKRHCELNYNLKNIDNIVLKF